jgi:hypothetical protein
MKRAILASILVATLFAGGAVAQIPPTDRRMIPPRSIQLSAQQDYVIKENLKDMHIEQVPRTKEIRIGNKVASDIGLPPLGFGIGMNRRQQWRKVLEAEMRRWSALSYDQLISRLSTIEVYEVEHDFKKYQVEIEILEKREDYVHVAVSVDDGSLPSSIWPATESFIQKKPSSSA